MKYLRGFLMGLGILSLFSLATSIISGIVIWTRTPSVPERTLLVIDFEQGVPERLPDDPAARLMGGGGISVQDLVSGLEIAAGDDRVAGVLARIGGSRLGPARIQEIRDAVAAFRRSGKPAVAFTDTFGELGPANGAYYLATAFDEIHMQPSGGLELTGVMARQPFVKGALDMLGVTPRMDRREEYKTAMNMFTETGYTEPHSESVRHLIEAIFSRMVADIAEARKLPAETVRERVDHGVFMGEEAVEAGFVDGLHYADEVRGRLVQRLGGDCEDLKIAQYLKRVDPLYAKGKTIALIHAVGVIHRGKSEYDPLSGEMRISAQKMAEAFRSAIEDEDVKAIVFRVDSPGGSYVGSDAIWREVVHARAAGKPVIVSMGDLAASGGYFVAAPADKIVAQPGTLTGSIGVYAGKMITTGFWNMLGVTWDEAHTSENSAMWSAQHDFTDEQWEIFQRMLDRIYADFTGKVAEGRNLAIERVREIAKGRVWTGEDALERGLVDALGGFKTALGMAMAAAGIRDGEPVRLKRFPAPRGFFESVMERLSVSLSPGLAAVVKSGLEAIRPAVRTLDAAGGRGPRELLRMPDLILY